MKENKICGVEISSQNRTIFPQDKISKLDVVRYYEKVANKMLVFLKNRPISVIRCHTNILGEKFYKKHAQKNEDVERFFDGKSKSDRNEFFYIKTKRQLINQVQLGSIEFHAWNCKINDTNHPDLMIFDLDPDVNLPIDKLRLATKIVKKTLNKLKLKCFLKTSGGKGYHVYSKVENLTYLQVNRLAKGIAEMLENEYPNLFVSNMNKEKRQNKVFVDYLRNKKGATCVCPYSLRLRKTAPISMPICWKDLDKILPDEVNLKNFCSYLKI